MEPMSRSNFSGGRRFVALFGAGVAAALGAAGLQAQEIVELPAEDRLISPDFEPVYRIGSAAAAAEREEFTSISGIAFDGAGNLYLLDGTRTSADVRIVVVDGSSDEPGPIDVVSPDGRYMGTLQTGTAALPDMPDAFGPDGLVAFLDEDAFEVPVIAVRRLPPQVR